MENLTAALVQTTLYWENPTQNRQMLAAKLETLSNKPDLIVLPEMYTTGFTMNAIENFELPNGSTTVWQKEQSQKHQALILGSIIIKDNDAFYNRLLATFPDGTIKTYDKRHTFTLAGEDKVYRAGNKHQILKYKSWTINPLICYDLRFPVWARNTQNYDLLIYVANWPNKRIAAWDALLKARAIENMSYCIGVNRIGLDGKNFEYSGHSAAYDVLGNRIDSIAAYKDTIETVLLDKKTLIAEREKLQFLADKDDFTLK